MKKTFISIAMLATVGFAAFNMNLGTKSNNLSGISLANVEALAQGESNDACKSSPNYLICSPVFDGYYLCIL
ncbi:hypothetical protein FACS189474_1030 [Bacteroidia bacterium]|nr:hypothetical protein FACS189474_1030 [Bacteroidia bacterium]